MTVAAMRCTGGLVGAVQMRGTFSVFSGVGRVLFDLEARGVVLRACASVFGIADDDPEDEEDKYGCCQAGERVDERFGCHCLVSS